MLTRQELLKRVVYDPVTGSFSCAKTGKLKGSVEPRGYVQIGIGYKVYYAHRLAWLYVHGCFPEGDIDHIDGNRSNNTISNLRDVSRSVNLQNKRRAEKTNLLGLMGVSKNTKGYRARIKVNGVERHIGTFNTPEEAHEAYLREKRLIHAGCTI